MKHIDKFTQRASVLSLVAALAVTAAPAVAGNKLVPEDHVSQVRYDWLETASAADRKQPGLSAAERRRLASRIARHGNGSYICSPSGFGKKSRCYAR